MFEWIVMVLLTDITPTISVIELVWTIPALFAWVRYGDRAWHACRAQWRLRRERQRLSLRMREKIRAERFLFLAFASECMTLIGLGSMMQPPSPAQVIESPLGLIGPLLLIAAQWAIILKGEIIERDEQALLWLYEREAQAARGSRPVPDVKGYLHGLP